MHEGQLDSAIYVEKTCRRETSPAAGKRLPGTTLFHDPFLAIAPQIMAMHGLWSSMSTVSANNERSRMSITC